MKKITLQLLIVFALAFSVSAQENKPELFDEFGEMPIDEMRFRVINLALEVNKVPNSKALIEIYGRQKRSFASAYIRGSLMKSIWEKFIKLPPEKLLIQFCNINKEPILTKLSVVRENDKIEPCDENLIVPKETVLFESSYFDVTDFSVSEIKFISVENDYPSVEGTEGNYSEIAQNVLKKFLKNSPGSRIYIIAYLNANFETIENDEFVTKKIPVLDRKSHANKMFRAARKVLIKNGFSPSQIVAIDGGYVKGNERRLEFWFVPNGGDIPKPQPDYFPKRAKRTLRPG